VINRVEGDLDIRIRSAAFEHVRRLNATHDYLSSQQLAEGFPFEGSRIPLVNPQRGIFKPRQMRHLLSIRTVFPKPGAKIWYDDQRQVHRQIYQSDDLVEYAFMGNNPDAADNRWLREACEQRIPIIYFIGIAPGRFVAQVPAFIAEWNRHSLKASVGFGEPVAYGGAVFPDELPARRYALSAVKQRLHQATFRQAVLTAYEGRCALSGLPEPMLLPPSRMNRVVIDRMGRSGARAKRPRGSTSPPSPRSRKRAGLGLRSRLDGLRRGTPPVFFGRVIVRPHVEPEIRGGDPLSTDQSTARIAGSR